MQAYKNAVHLQPELPALIFDTELRGNLVSCCDRDFHHFFIFCADPLPPEAKIRSLFGEAFNNDDRIGNLKLKIFDNLGSRFPQQFESGFRRHYLVGFNSLCPDCDDDWLKERGIRIQTTYDLLYEIRLALGMPPVYRESTKDKIKWGYSLERMSRSNFGLGKCDLPCRSVRQTWLAGDRIAVIRYALRDVYLTLKLWENRDRLIDPNTGKPFACRPLRDAIALSAELAWFAPV